jgi:hypothetical protein
VSETELVLASGPSQPNIDGGTVPNGKETEMVTVPNAEEEVEKDGKLIPK